MRVTRAHSKPATAMRLSIKTKLAALFGIAALVSAGQAALSISDLHTVHGTITDVATNWLPSVDAINRINTATRDSRVKLYRLVVASPTPQLMAENKQALLKVQEELARLNKTYDGLVSSPEERALFDRFTRTWAEYQKGQLAAVADMDAGRQPEALAKLVKPELAALAVEATSALREDIDLNKNGADASSREGLSRAESAMRNAAIAATLGARPSNLLDGEAAG